MGFWSFFKKASKVTKVGIRIATYFTPEGHIVDQIDKAINKVESSKGDMDLTMLKAKKSLTKTAVDYALENMDVLSWAKEEVETNNLDIIKGYMMPLIKGRYDKEKKKIKKKIK